MTSVSTETTPEAAPAQLLIVEVSSALYGIPGVLVKEIATGSAITRLPGAPDHIRGLMNLRGQLITVVDLTQRVTGGATRNPEPSTIVVESGARTLGLMVDDVHDVQSVDAAAAEDLPYRPAARSLSRALGRLGTEVVIVLDIDQLVRETFG